MEILGIIPARGGSKGIPKKNIKMLGDKTLLEFTWESARNSKFLNTIILSSDDNDTISLAKDLGITVPFERPKEFATDEATSLQVVKHAINFFRSERIYFDAVCLLQPTNPFRPEDLIDDCIIKFQEGSFDSVVSVRQVPHEFNPHWVFEKYDDKLKISTGENEIIPRRQELPPAYFRDGAVYITKTEVILEKNSLLGTEIGFVDTTGTPFVNIDLPEDWKKAEEYLRLM